MPEILSAEEIDALLSVTNVDPKDYIKHIEKGIKADKKWLDTLKYIETLNDEYLDKLFYFLSLVIDNSNQGYTDFSARFGYDEIPEKSKHMGFSYPNITNLVKSIVNLNNRGIDGYKRSMEEDGEDIEDIELQKLPSLGKTNIKI